MYLSVAVALPGAPDPEKLRKQKELSDKVESFLIETDYPKLRKVVAVWGTLSASDRVLLTEIISNHLRTTTKSGLTNPQDLIIPYRNDVGDLKFQGHGDVVYQDLFIVGGKAAWMIEELTGVRLPEINEGLDKDSRERRANEIVRYTVSYKLATSLVFQEDYAALVKAMAEWQSLPGIDKVRLVEVLAPYLRSIDRVGLNGNGELLITYRRRTNDQPPLAWKKYTDQDLFTVGGKAAWAIEELTGVRLPEINEGLDKDERYRRVEIITQWFVPGYKIGVKHGSATPLKK